MNKSQENKLYMDIAHRVSRESYCAKKQVGAVILSAEGVISLGFNGTPSGAPNVCEVQGHLCYPSELGSFQNQSVTKTHYAVIHAEENALAKMAKGGYYTEDAIVYSTINPCPECTKMLCVAGINDVYYRFKYKTQDHFEYYQDLGMNFYQVDADGDII